MVGSLWAALPFLSGAAVDTDPPWAMEGLVGKDCAAFTFLWGALLPYLFLRCHPANQIFEQWSER